MADRHTPNAGLSPDDKYKAWRDDLELAIKKGTCPFQELEALVGRLNHSTMVVPLTRHFLSRIRNRLAPKYRRGDRNIRLGCEAVDDMKLWLKILARANVGIPISLIVTRQPDRVCWSDSCPYGIGVTTCREERGDCESQRRAHCEGTQE